MYVRDTKSIIDLRVTPIGDESDAPKAIAAVFIVVWLVFTISFLAKLNDRTRLDLLAPAVIIPIFLTIGYTMTRVARRSNVQIVEFLCQVLQADVVSGPS